MFECRSVWWRACKTWLLDDYAIPHFFYNQLKEVFYLKTQQLRPNKS
jgi:hypothetical protein